MRGKTSSGLHGTGVLAAGCLTLLWALSPHTAEGNNRATSYQGPNQPTSSAVHKAVVVELFTSEGCSTCPPADELLGRLRQQRSDGVEIIPLGFHVDYWNSQGWTDRFSSAAYSRRQDKYAQWFRIEGPYTPQMVVNGSAQFVGNNAPYAEKAIEEAALRPQLIEVQISFTEADKLWVRVSGQGGPSDEVMLAVTEDNLTSKVHAGENDGRELHHWAVVRQLERLGQFRGGSFEAHVPLKFHKDWKREDLRVAVLVQDRSGRIQGAASVPVAALDLPKSSKGPKAMD